VTSFCRTAGMVALAAFFAADHARSEDLDCTRYVPQIGKTVRVRCNDEPAAAPAEPKPSPGTDHSTEPVPGTNLTPGNDPTPVREADSAPCLNEQNPGTTMGICQVFLSNNAGLSQTTKVSVYRKLAYAALRIKDYQSALSWSKKSLEFTPSAVEHYIAGQAYAAMKNPSAAIVEFSSAITLAPKYTLALYRRGEAFQEIGDTANARSDFEAAVALVAKFTPALEALRRLKRRG
jgi:tetratricopeptide (TPR) repeat protein